MIDKEIAKKALMAQTQATAQVAETYTGAWATWRKILEEQNNLHMLVSVVNTLLDDMKAQNINVLSAAARKCIELEMEASKLIVMAAAVEILLGKFQPGTKINVNDLRNH